MLITFYINLCEAYNFLHVADMRNILVACYLLCLMTRVVYFTLETILKMTRFNDEGQSKLLSRLPWIEKKERVNDMASQEIIQMSDLTRKPAKDVINPSLVNSHTPPYSSSSTDWKDVK